MSTAQMLEHTVRCTVGHHSDCKCGCTLLTICQWPSRNHLETENMSWVLVMLYVCTM